MAEWEQDEAIADPIGARLKSARENQGMSLDDVAAKTRVPIRHLMHMENGDWDELPAPTYSVGFARAYATAVGLNAAEIGSELRAQLVGTKPMPTPSYYEPADPARVPPRSLVMIVGGLIILLVAAYFIWRSTAVGSEDVAPVAQTETPPAVAPPGPAPAPAAGSVVLTAISDVWLRVYEAGGPKLYENTLKAGEQFVVPATAVRPQILTGRPDAVRVTVGTTQIPPLGAANKSIADVSLLPADLLARSTPPRAPAATAPASRGPAPPPAANRPAAAPAAPPPAAPAPATPPATPPAGTP
jgi:transcriptional regulator with XRE-family HTH domain